jgi:hypothetical protein
MTMFTFPLSRSASAKWAVSGSRPLWLPLGIALPESCAVRGSNSHPILVIFSTFVHRLISIAEAAAQELPPS